MPGIKRRRLRKGYFQGVFFDPDGIRREMLWENVVPALQSPGYYDAMVTLWGYDIRNRLEEIDVPAGVGQPPEVEREQHDDQRAEPEVRERQSDETTDAHGGVQARPRAQRRQQAQRQADRKGDRRGRERELERGR